MIGPTDTVGPTRLDRHRRPDTVGPVPRTRVPPSTARPERQTAEPPGTAQKTEQPRQLNTDDN
nr:hypothetical protein ISGA_06985 [Gordonia sp. NB41Y]